MRDAPAGSADCDALRVTLLAAVVVVAPATVPADGLHDDTRQFTPSSQMSDADWSDPAEMERAWQAALVRVPGPHGVIETTVRDLPTAGVPDAPRQPTVIYLHGCSGVWAGTYRRIDLLAANGFAVIAPVSLAREKYPQSCDVASHRGGLYRHTLAMRQHDAGHAIARAKTLPWVDSGNVFLMGLSEGATATATFAGSDAAVAVNARVVEGWTCQSGWREYRGINAPPDEPVLTLVARNDPWFDNEWARGHCGTDIDPANGSRAVVYEAAHLRTRHELLDDAEVQQTVLEFLHRHRRQ